MNICKGTFCTSFLLVSMFSGWAHAQTQPAPSSRFVVDLGVGIDVSVNGNVNSGAIGRLQGQAAAILPNPYRGGIRHRSALQVRWWLRLEP